MKGQQQPSNGPLRFVITNPASNEGRAERIRDVRSHAGRWRWRQARKGQYDKSELNEDAIVKRLSELSGPTDPSTRTSTTVADNDEDPLEAGSSFLWRIGQLVLISCAFRWAPDVTWCRHARSLSDTCPIASLWRNCLSVLWPILMPGTTNTADHPGVQAWFSLSLSDPALHSSMLFGACSHRWVQCIVKRLGNFSSKDARDLALAESDSISKINSAIQDPSKATSDAIILSVLCLANNHSPLEQHPKPYPFDPPLRKLQWLDAYGYLSPNSVHQAGLAILIALRGGLDKLELPGLAAVISFSDVLGASRSLTRPRFPFIGLQTNTPSFWENIGWCNGGYTDAMDIDLLLSLGITPEMYRTFQAARAYMAFVELFLDGAHMDMQSALFCDSRNFVQWHIMSLLPASHLGLVNPMVIQVHEACRLGLVIFGIGVIFPLPPESAPFLKLVRLLQLELQMCAKDSMTWTHTVPEMKIRCWCLVLGGIAAIGTSEREWFVAELRLFKEKYSISTWNQVRRIMKSILWLDVVCNGPGEELWREVVRLSSRGSDFSF
ncbi:conserved hypothetical protein [Talaromyces stipitatus ATCC 10500]|uniref:Transcription factor domain-containing protein n=1 Tax=Talaromyces stipitatus (strain ATCC 10500 / CBS 375.48 / QM 6759 / NRRL 1006) TaxID=441959 RepID=B8M6J8_TALSN|nr:uncharacterized protein TSTA_027540 [Talaromyces stipitatus ATCC 10500]EED19460.1 conserved hypothetical protein [Talaromyces stipitatus ATCC 10500]